MMMFWGCPFFIKQFLTLGISGGDVSIFCWGSLWMILMAKKNSRYGKPMILMHFKEIIVQKPDFFNTVIIETHCEYLWFSMALKLCSSTAQPHRGLFAPEFRSRQAFQSFLWHLRARTL